MKKVILKRTKILLTWIMLVVFINVWSVSNVYAYSSDDDKNQSLEGEWEDEENQVRSSDFISISVFYNSQYLTIQDSNPVNTITVKITSNETGATVFENVYPQGQTSFIVIPMDGWSAGSYTIELFGRENNGYLWGTFQVLP